MNLVGKIFTVLIFLMCVVFGTFALMVHAAHKNWKVEVMALNDKLTEANKLKANLEEQKKNAETALADEKEKTEKRLTALENQRKIVLEDRDKKESEILKVEASNRDLTMTISGVHKRLGVLQTLIDGMRNDIKVAVDERNSTTKQLVNKTDELNNAVAERERVEKLERGLVAQLNKMNEALEYTKTPLTNEPPAGLVGEVTSATHDVVEISVGADDGVRVGHKFVVRRPSTGKYIGKIDVIKVDFPNRAVCRPDKSMLIEPIQKGDQVRADTAPIPVPTRRR